MPEQESINYNQIAEIIEKFQKKTKLQPNLDEIARQMNLSSLHLQRLFSEWAGTTVQNFLQYISIERAQKLLEDKQVGLFDTMFSNTNYLHDFFINIEEMTPTEYKSLFIHYSFAQSPFGNLIVASTSKGVCYMAFEDNKTVAFNSLYKKFPNAVFQQKLDFFQQNALFIFQNAWDKLLQIKLHVKGTSFQLKVWGTLLKIPMGELSTYGSIAKQISQPYASRAVGTAIGSNPVAFLIPCHRVIQASGNFGGYMWGNIRKTAIIGWEGAKTNAKI